MNVDNKLFKRYYKNYIDGVSIENIEFKKFSYSELQEFLRNNYYDDELKRPVYWRPNGFVSPFGLQYLDFTSYSDDLSYLLGIVDNSSGKKTIVFCMEYDNNYNQWHKISLFLCKNTMGEIVRRPKEKGRF